MPTTPITGPDDAALPPERPDEVSVDIDEELHLAKLRVDFAGEDSVPVCFRQWDVERKLGSGGMGVVYLARHRELGRRVALKVLKPTSGDAEVRTLRFIREAQALARVRHDNVLQIHQVDASGERAVIEMEYIEGPTLRAWQSHADRSWRTIVAAYASVGDGLAALHEVGLLHRDIKPDNLLIDGDDRVKIVDLGLAVAIRRANDQNHNADATTDDSALALRLTADGAIVGTHGYMAPEVIVGAEITPASDQFSLAVSLYEAVYGQRPFTGSSPNSLADAIRNGTLTKARDRRRRPRWLLRILRRGLCFEPDRRYPSITAFVRALRRGLWFRRLFGLGSSAVILLVGLPTATWFFKPLPADPCADAGAEMHEVWNPDARDELSSHASAHASPEVERSLMVLVSTLDSRTRAWTEARTQLCMTEVKRQTTDREPAAAELDLDLRQQACLSHVRKGLDALLAESRTAKDDLARRYTDVAAAIEALPTCDDRRALAGWAVVAPDDKADAALTRALAAEAAGRYPEAAASARQAVERSRDSDPLRHAEALYRLGHVLGLERRYSLAIDTLDQARNTAFAIGHDELVCRAMAFQAKLSAAVGNEPAVAKRELGLARACVERVGARSPILHADLLEAAGLLAEATGEREDAILRHQEALALRRSYFGDAHLDTTKSLHNLANALAATGGPARTAVAREHYDEALRLRVELLGADHPEVADLLFDLGEFRRLGGASAEARICFIRALEIYSNSPGTHDHARARLHLGLAGIDIEDGDLAAAAAHLQRAAQIQASTSDTAASDIDTARRLHLEGILALQGGRYAESAKVLRRATALYRRAHANEAALDSLIEEIEADYGLEDWGRIAALVGDEGEALERHVRSLDADARVPLAWYIGNALINRGDNVAAVTYLRVARDAYAALGNETYANELQGQLVKYE